MLTWEIITKQSVFGWEEKGKEKKRKSEIDFPLSLRWDRIVLKWKPGMIKKTPLRAGPLYMRQLYTSPRIPVSLLNERARWREKPWRGILGNLKQTFQHVAHIYIDGSICQWGLYMIVPLPRGDGVPMLHESTSQKVSLSGNSWRK